MGRLIIRESSRIGGRDEVKGLKGTLTNTHTPAQETSTNKQQEVDIDQFKREEWTQSQRSPGDGIAKLFKASEDIWSNRSDER